MAEQSVSRVRSRLGKVRLVPQAWLGLWAMALPRGVRARVSSLLACEGRSPWQALDPVPAFFTQRLPRRAGEKREAHIGRALGRVGPSMLLCSLSEAICFFLGEPGQLLPTKCHLEVVGCGQPPSLCTHF